MKPPEGLCRVLTLHCLHTLNILFCRAENRRNHPLPLRRSPPHDGLEATPPSQLKEMPHRFREQSPQQGNIPPAKWRPV